MIRLLVSVADANSASDWYRGSGPFSALEREFDDIDIEYSPSPSWQKIRSASCVFLLRPCRSDQVNTAQMCREFGVPLWVDYDDDLFSLTLDNLSYDYYAKQEVRHNMERCLRLANQVTVTTGNLAEAFSRYNSEISVVPNAFDSLFGRILDSTEAGTEFKSSPNLVLWRGSPTHERDLRSVEDEIVDASEKFPEFKFAFLGYQPWFLMERMKSLLTFPKTDFYNYWKMIAALRPKVVISPLADTRFNKSKSNIAAIEGTFCGAITVAPDWETWRKPFCVNYKPETPGSFGHALKTLLSQNEAPLETFKKRRESQYEWLKGPGSLDTANLIRRKLLEKLHERSAR